MDNPSDLLPESTSRDRLNTWVAVFVALFATFMAVTKVKDDNIVQAMLQAKSDAVDTWSATATTEWERWTSARSWYRCPLGPI